MKIRAVSIINIDNSIWRKAERNGTYYNEERFERVRITLADLKDSYIRFYLPMMLLIKALLMSADLVADLHMKLFTDLCLFI